MEWVSLDEFGLGELHRVTGVSFLAVNLLVAAERDINHRVPASVLAATFYSTVGCSSGAHSCAHHCTGYLVADETVRLWPEYVHDPEQHCDGVRILRRAAAGGPHIAIDLSCSEPALLDDLIAGLLADRST